MTIRSSSKPHVVHIIQHLIQGGLENGLINLINRMDATLADHTIVCLSHFSDFQNRIERQDVQVVALGKKAGQDPRVYLRLLAILRRVRPSIVHTRNYGTLDCSIVARIAGVKCRIHGQHGFALEDVGGIAYKRRLMRRFCHPFVSHHVVLSEESKEWLHDSFGIPKSKITQIYNGVDTDKFSPRGLDSDRNLRNELGAGDDVVFGTVGRLEPVKDPMNLARAFARLANDPIVEASKVRLLIVGDGPLRQDLTRFLDSAGCAGRYTITGTVNNVDSYLRCMDVFVMPSRVEGISNTILEAMATGLPIVATRVGGNSELVADDYSGFLVPPESSNEIASRMLEYYKDQPLRKSHGLSARNSVSEKFSLQSMIEGYTNLYLSLLDS